MEEQALQRFIKPDKEFLEDKECLICLEPMDLEMNQIVKLPCGCANSAYHILCIVKLLASGKNKNFCPHCKTEYNLLPKQHDVPVVPFPVVPVPVVPVPVVPFPVVPFPIVPFPIVPLTHIMMAHLLSNTLMNIINIAVSRSYPNYNKQPEFQVLILFYFLKLFLNFCMLVYAKNDIETALLYSYVYQTVLFGLLIYVLAKIKNDSFLTALLANNLLFGITDLAFRFVLECKMRNRVVSGG
jgi:hypothetical protein